MLVLSRREGETILLPDLGISIQITAIKAGRVRVGVEAPPNVLILRKEALERPPEPARRA